MKIDYTKYALAMIVTTALFGSAYFASSYFMTRRLSSIDTIQENLHIEDMSNQVQYDLLQEASCANVTSSSILSEDLAKTGDKLSYTESELGATNSNVLYLKKYYSLLQIKDYLLSKKLAEKCASKKTIFIIYMYSNGKDAEGHDKCNRCSDQAVILTALREKYPELRVYTFDYDLDLSAVETLKKIYRIPATFPALIVQDKLYTGFQSLETLDTLMPDNLVEATSTATTTATTTIKSATTTKN